ncbi:MAG: rhodanese-like domain-containing protein [Coriobacteriales bacterium]|jgi:phage shock protein E
MTMIRRITISCISLCLLAASMLTLIGCAGGNGSEPYQTIDSDEAARIMREESFKFIVDVRTPEEYAAGHIPDAINIPVESIGDEPPAMLPAPDELVMVYCRTGRRSAQAAQLLVNLGYTNVVDFGGIESWEGEVVTG